MGRRKIIRVDPEVVQSAVAQEEPSLKEKTARGLFWGGISNFIQQVIGMAFGIAIARILSPDDYGLVAMLAIFTAVADTVMDSGFTTALVNRKIIEHKDYNAVFWFNVLIAIGIYIILFFAAPWIARFYNQPVLLSLARVLFLTFIVSATGVAHNALLLKKIMAKQRGIIDMAAVFGSGTIGLILALNGLAFWGLVIQQLSQVLIAVLLRWYFSPWRPTFEFDWAPLKDMFGFSVKVFFGAIVGMISANLFSVVLGRYYRETETGYYTQGRKWATLGISVLSGMFVGVVQSVLVETSDSRERLVNVVRRLLRFGSLITFPLMLGLAFVAKEFILLTIGAKWMGSIVYLQLFCLWGCFSFLEIVYVYLLLSIERPAENFYIDIVMCIFQIAGIIIVSQFGILAMIIIYILIRILSIWARHYFAYKSIKIRISTVVKDIFPYAATAIFSILVTWFIAKGTENIYLAFGIKIAFVALLYTGILWMANSAILKESASFIFRKVKPFS